MGKLVYRERCFTLFLRVENFILLFGYFASANFSSLIQNAKVLLYLYSGFYVVFSSLVLLTDSLGYSKMFLRVLGRYREYLKIRACMAALVPRYKKDLVIWYFTKWEMDSILFNWRFT